jgi:hypothetical protein
MAGPKKYEIGTEVNNTHEENCKKRKERTRKEKKRKEKKIKEKKLTEDRKCNKVVKVDRKLSWQMQQGREGRLKVDN